MNTPEQERLLFDLECNHTAVVATRDFKVSIYSRAIGEIKRLQEIIDTKLHQRKCHDCGHTFYAASGTIPDCLCERCGTPDTRRIKP